MKNLQMIKMAQRFMKKQDEQKKKEEEAKGQEGGNTNQGNRFGANRQATFTK